MVKSIIGDDAQLTATETHLSQSATPVQVGIIIGKLSPTSDRGYVYALIPTPPTDSGSPACVLKSEPKKAAKGAARKDDAKAALLVDGDWVAEHARQVSRMLMGGMDVVGVYVWAPEGPFKATPPAVLSQTVMGVAQAAPWYDREFNERLLIHISYSPRRWACRICTLTSGNLRPCDFKLGKLVSSLQAFRCIYNFEIRLPIVDSGASNSSSFKNTLSNGISRHSKELQSAKAIINGNLIPEDQPSTSEGLQNVELLLPFINNASAEVYSTEEVVGIVVFSGVVCASAYLGPKEPISQAISDLKGDIIASLRGRLDIISEEAEGEVDPEINAGGESTNENEVSVGKFICRTMWHKTRRPFVISFPRRVLVPWVSGVFICDYLQPFETFEDVKARCKEMLSMDTSIQTSAILEPESESATVTTKSFWDVVHEGRPSPVDASFNGGQPTQDKLVRQSKGNKFNFLAAAIILLLAIFGGLVLTFLQPFGAAR